MHLRVFKSYEANDRLWPKAAGQVINCRTTACDPKRTLAKVDLKKATEIFQIYASDEIECDDLSAYVGRTKADINRCNFSFDPDEQS